MLDYAEQNGITDIILVAGFSSYLNGTSYNNGEGGIRGFEGVDLIEIKDKNLSQNNKKRISRVSKEYKKQLSSLSKKFRLFVFHSPPIVGWDVPKYYAHKAMFDKDN